MSGNHPHVCFVSEKVYTYLSEGDVKLAGGAERQQYLIGKVLTERRYQISYITGAYDGPARETLEGYTVYKSIPLDSGVTGAPLKLWRLFQAIRECDADIYYARGNPFHCILVATICKILNNKFVYSIANDEDVETERLRKRANRLYIKSYMIAIQSAAAVATLTNHQQSVLRSEHGIDATVIPVGYDLPCEKNLVSTANREFLFWAGRIVEYNRPNAFIDLAEALPDYEFVMAGPVENENEFATEVVQRAEATENLSYIGFVPPSEIHEYFQNAIAYIQTTHTTAGFGNTTLEAWRYQTPVITLHTTYDNRIKDHRLGLYSEGSIDQLITNTQRLLDSSNLQHELGENGRAYLRKHFSLDSVVDQYDNLFRSILGDCSSR